jgi:hypothetical protein
VPSVGDQGVQVTVTVDVCERQPRAQLPLDAEHIPIRPSEGAFLPREHAWKNQSH